jgi:ribosomal protein S27E
MRRKSDTKVKCEICGKMVFPRGLKSHIRLQHELSVVETTKVLDIPVKVEGNSTTEVKKIIEVNNVYTPLAKPKVECCRCGTSIEVTMPESTRTRISRRVACDKCINTWYSEKGRQESFLFSTYNSSGESIFDQVRSNLLKSLT